VAERKELRQNKSIDRIKAEHEAMLSDLEALENLTPEAASQVYAELDYMVSHVHEAVRKATSLEEAGDTTKGEPPAAKGLGDVLGAAPGGGGQIDAKEGLDSLIGAAEPIETQSTLPDRSAGAEPIQDGTVAIPLDDIIKPAGVSSPQPMDGRGDEDGEDIHRDTGDLLDDVVQSTSRQPLETRSDESSKEETEPVTPPVSLEEYAKQQGEVESRVNYKQLDEFINKRRSQWQSEAYPNVDPQDLEKDPGWGQPPDMTQHLPQFASELNSSLRSMEMMFRKIVLSLSETSRAINEMQSTLSRNGIF